MSLAIATKMVELEAQLKEAKAEVAMWRALANQHRDTVFGQEQTLKKLRQEVETWKGIADNHCNTLLKKNELLQGLAVLNLQLRREIQDLHEEVGGLKYD